MPRRKNWQPPSQTPYARLIGLGGQKEDGSPDVAGIAKAIGRSPGTVRRLLKRDAFGPHVEKHIRGVEVAIERSEARKPGWVAHDDEGFIAQGLIGPDDRKMPPPQDVRASLMSVFGKDGKLDTKRAAAELGVSVRTVQRWANGTSRPKATYQKALRQQVRQVAVKTSKKAARMKNLGATVTIKGRIVISDTVEEFTRIREMPFELSPGQMRRIERAHIQGGERAAQEQLKREVLDSKYAREAGVDENSIVAIKRITMS